MTGNIRDLSIKERLRSLGVEPSRGLGQNFLVDEDIAERIVSHASISPDDTVLEIGPGLGVLSEHIAETGCRLIMIEKDDRLADMLEGMEMFGSSKVHEGHRDSDIGDNSYRIEMIRGDAMDVEFPPFDRVISNLPFQISSPLTFKVLKHDFKNAVLTYQKEFGDRLVAEPGDSNYSRLSVMVSTHAEVKRLFGISRHDFYPSPKVDASVMELIPKEPDFDLDHPEAFSRVIKELFKYRRKMIRSALKTARASGKLDYSEIKNTNKIPYEKKRVGNLRPEQISEIADYLIKERDLKIYWKTLFTEQNNVIHR